LWVADITYLPTYEGNSYVSLITDAYSRKIVGYSVDDNMQTKAVKQAFIRALKERRNQDSLIHHSDRGSQYCSKEYQDLHSRHKIVCSMTDGYDCYQNALAERVNGILKDEFLIYRCNTFDELQQLIKESVEVYNSKRPHLSLGYKTPNFVHQKTTEDNLQWSYI